MLNIKTLHLPIARPATRDQAQEYQPTAEEIVNKYASHWQPPTPTNGGVGKGYLYSHTDEAEQTRSYFDDALRDAKGE